MKIMKSLVMGFLLTFALHAPALHAQEAGSGLVVESDQADQAAALLAESGPAAPAPTTDAEGNSLLLPESYGRMYDIGSCRSAKVNTETTWDSVKDAYGVDFWPRGSLVDYINNNSRMTDEEKDAYRVGAEIYSDAIGAEQMLCKGLSSLDSELERQAETIAEGGQAPELPTGPYPY